MRGNGCTHTHTFRQQQSAVPSLAARWPVLLRSVILALDGSCGFLLNSNIQMHVVVVVVVLVPDRGHDHTLLCPDPGAESRAGLGPAAVPAVAPGEFCQ